MVNGSHFHFVIYFLLLVIPIQITSYSITSLLCRFVDALFIGDRGQTYTFTFSPVNFKNSHRVCQFLVTLLGPVRSVSMYACE